MGGSANFEERLVALRRGLTDAGATLVEYALVIALLTVVSIPAIQYLTDGTRDQVNNEANCVSRRPPPPDCQIPSVPAPQPPDEDEVDPDQGDPLPPAGMGDWYGTAIKTVYPEGTWSLERQVQVSNSEGPIANAFVAVAFTIVNPPGQPIFYATCTTDANGVCTVTYLTPVPATRIRVAIDQVTSEPPTDTLPPAQIFDRD